MDSDTAAEPRIVPTSAPEPNEAWEMVVGQLRMEMRRPDYESWVQPLRAQGFTGGVFRLGAINAYTRDWVDSRLRTRIARLLEGVYGQPVSVQIALDPSLANGGPSKPLPGAVISAAAASPAPQDRPNQARTDPARGPNGAPAPARANGGRPAHAAQPETGIPDDGGSPRKLQLQRAYGTERARVVQPERGMFLTTYFFNHWLPLLGHSAATTVLAARSLCYWNPMTGELRNMVETEMSELAARAAVSVRTVKEVLNNELVRRYFLRYKVRRMMTVNGVRTAGILLQVRMDDPLTPADQAAHNLPEEEHWYTIDVGEGEE